MRPDRLQSDVNNLELDDAGRYLRLHDFALGMSHQSLSDRSRRRELALCEIRLGLAHEGELHFFAERKVLHTHLIEHLHLVSADLGLINNPGIGKLVLKLGDVEFQKSLSLTRRLSPPES